MKMTIPVEFSYSRVGEAKSSSPEPGVVRTLGAYNQKFLVVQNQVSKGWVGVAHSHPHDQAVFVVSGQIRLACQGNTVELTGGDSFVVAGGIEHQVTALEDSVVVDLFTPCREEFLG